MILERPRQLFYGGFGAFPYRAIVSSGAGFNPFEVNGALDGYIADEGILVAGGLALQAEDQTGNGNTIVQSAPPDGPEFVSEWRNGRAALLGRAAGVAIGLVRASHVQGPIAQPWTRYLVGSWGVTTSSRTLFSGASLQGRSFALNDLPGIAAGVNLLAASTVTVGAAVIVRNVFSGAGSSIRVEPHGEPIVGVAGNAGPLGFNGVGWLGGFGPNWRGHGAFALDVAGDLPLTTPALDAQIMQWLRDYYQIYHT